ncbi:hypothetical protein ACFL1E_07725 [Candidatus Omnitrophota bacterium]
MKATMRFATTKNKAQALVLGLLLTLVVSWVAVPIIMTAIGHMKSSDISNSAVKARELAEAGVFKAIDVVRDSFELGVLLHPSFPDQSLEIGPDYEYEIWPNERFPESLTEELLGYYAVTVILVEAPSAPFDPDAPDNQIRRYLFTSTGRYVLPKGGEVTKTVKAAITYDYFARKTYGIDERTLGPDYLHSRNNILYFDAHDPSNNNFVHPGKYRFDYEGEYDRDQGRGATAVSPNLQDETLASEDIYIILDDSVLWFPEWKDANPLYYSEFLPDGTTLDAGEFLVPWDMQDNSTQRFENIDEFGIHPGDDNVYPLEVFERDPDEPLIAELLCDDTYGAGDFRPVGVGCSGDLDLEEGAPCDNLCDEVEFAVNNEGLSYYEACLDRCMYDSGDPEKYSFQLDHPDAEAANFCDPNICMGRTCPYYYQWTFFNSQCRQECKPLFEPDYDNDPDGTDDDNGNLQQSVEWNQCMVDCSEAEERADSGRTECQDLCSDYQTCLEYFGGIYQDLADPTDLWNGTPAHKDFQGIVDDDGGDEGDVERQFVSQCRKMCKDVDSLGSCRSECDGAFFRRDITGDFVILTGVRVAKHFNKMFYWKDGDGSRRGCDWPCESPLAGSIHFEDGGSFTLRVDDDHKVMLMDFQWVDRDIQ